jgi:hypothetical protein
MRRINVFVAVTYIGPTNHVCSRKVQTFDDGMLDNTVRKINFESKRDQGKAAANSAVFAPKGYERFDIGDFIVFTQASFFYYSIDVFLATLDKAASGIRECGVQ